MAEYYVSWRLDRYSHLLQPASSEIDELDGMYWEQLGRYLVGLGT
jgi:hypothetical protein